MTQTGTRVECDNLDREPRSIAELLAPSFHCTWEGCEARFVGDMPNGWTYLLTCWSKYPRKNLVGASSPDIMREGALCPEHTRSLEKRLTAMDENSIVNESASL
jgi:hypothetical protein